MKQTLFVLGAVGLAALLGCSSSASRSTTGHSAASGDQASLLDRELFFGDPVIAGGKLSPDGKKLAFMKPHNGVRNIWVTTAEAGFDNGRPITHDERPVLRYFWSRDGRYILYSQDKGGNENWHVYAVDPTAPAGKDGVPEARDLTPVENARADIAEVPRDMPGSIIVGLNDRDPSYQDFYRVDIATGKRTLLVKNDQKVAGYLFDEKGNARLAVRMEDDGSSAILRVDGDKLTPIYNVAFGESAVPVHFHPDGKRVYIQTNKGAEIDLTRLMLLDLSNGTTELVEADPQEEVDFGAAVFHPETDELLATVYVADKKRIYPRSEALAKDLAILRAKLPEGEIAITSRTPDMSRWTVAVYRDVDPGSVYLYERATGEVSFLYRSRPDLPSEQLATMKPVRYPARDGLSIPAYLTVPRGVEAKNLPVVIHPHGGPWARDVWGYNPFAQFLANRGYAVLQPNFRASTGYGKKFLNAGNKQWGTGAMQHDLTDGVQWLVEQGIADPDRVCIFGGSYGGYAVLAGAAFTPDRYTCGIPYVAPSSLTTLLTSFPSYWKSMIALFHLRVGNPEAPTDRADLESRSPINFVDRIKIPLLVIQGANDPRVTQREADQIVVALRDKGHAVEYLLGADEGHGFRDPLSNKAIAVAIEKFLAKHLGGRVQEAVPNEIATRLHGLTVDISSVALEDSNATAKRVEQAMAAALPTADGRSLAPATLKYQAKLAMGAGTMEMEMTRAIEASTHEKTAAWKITDTMKTPMGQAIDTFTVEKNTLRPLARNLAGMAQGELTYSDKAVRGAIQGNDLDIPLTAPVLGDGPGFVIALAGLPLATDYSATVRQIAMPMMKLAAYELRVTGTEQVTIGNEEIATYVVQMTPLSDGGTRSKVHVRQTAPHHIVRGEYEMPAAMGGGSLTTELVPN